MQIDPPADLDAAGDQACNALLDDLPKQVADLDRREIEPDDALGAAYGDPAIVVSCGVEVPDSFDETSSCEVVNGVGWYLPSEELDDLSDERASGPATLTAVGYRPVVQVQVPADYRPDGVAAALAQVSTPVADHLRLVDDCL